MVILVLEVMFVFVVVFVLVVLVLEVLVLVLEVVEVEVARDVSVVLFVVLTEAATASSVVVVSNDGSVVCWIDVAISAVTQADGAGGKFAKIPVIKLTEGAATSAHVESWRE
mmetsp:Transcript_119089/g.186848  ORF Transcript_119089/g.186848 Transcript_119089/m.186848 type:complete len:112 (+) Transcript_119089:1016-1351(+)